MCSDTFLPPWKVSDYFGFQYMRDIDANERGHNTDFLFGMAVKWDVNAARYGTSGEPLTGSAAARLRGQW